MLGLKTVPQGERVMVLHTNGRVNYVDGPTRLAVFTAKVQPLRRYKRRTSPISGHPKKGWNDRACSRSSGRLV